MSSNRNELLGVLWVIAAELAQMNGQMLSGVFWALAVSQFSLSFVADAGDRA